MERGHSSSATYSGHARAASCGRRCTLVRRQGVAPRQRRASQIGFGGLYDRVVEHARSYAMARQRGKMSAEPHWPSERSIPGSLRK